MDVPGSVLFRSYRLMRALRNARGSRFIDRYDPSIRRGYDRLRGAGGKLLWDPGRGAFLIGLLERHRPRLVVEMGSGVSTLWFAAYARRHGAKVISVEQDACWAGLVRDTAGTEVIVAPLQPLRGREVRYGRALPGSADFVYVDGPAAPPGVTGKLICADVIDYVTAGERPAVIAIDGRIDTVAALHALLGGYEFRPEFAYGFAERDWRSALAMRPQSVFVRVD